MSTDSRHKWDLSSRSCEVCGVTEQEYIQSSEYFVMFCAGGRDDEAYKPSLVTQTNLNTTIKRCTCGAWHTSKPNNHSSWCDIK